jgi:hypothetical protein
MTARTVARHSACWLASAIWTVSDGPGRLKDELHPVPAEVARADGTACEEAAVLHLYVHDFNDDWDDDRMPATAMRPAEYLRRRPNWIPPYGDDSTLLLLDPQAWWRLDPAIGLAFLAINHFGPLGVLATQLAEAADRLTAGKRALIRSYIEANEQSYLALEPDGEVTRLSLLMPLPRAMQLSPLPPGNYVGPGDRRAELHNYVETHRDALRPTDAPYDNNARLARALQDIPLPSAGLAAALQQEAIDGLRLIRTLCPGESMPSWMPSD